jgi:hypothetical protein
VVADPFLVLGLPQARGTLESGGLRKRTVQPASGCSNACSRPVEIGGYQTESARTHT